MSSGGVNVSAALSHVLKSKKEEANIDDSVQLSETQQEYMRLKLMRLERNILVRCCVVIPETFSFLCVKVTLTIRNTGSV